MRGTAQMLTPRTSLGAGRVTAELDLRRVADPRPSSAGLAAQAVAGRRMLAKCCA